MSGSESRKVADGPVDEALPVAHEGHRLSAEALEEFESRGYTLLEDVFPPELNERLRLRLDEYLKGVRPLREHMGLQFQRRSGKKLARKRRFVRKLKHLEYDPLFWSLISDPRVVTPLVQILGPDIKVFRADVFYKAPKTGWSISPHQDAVYWPVAPIDDVFGTTCNFFYFLDDAGKENGGLGFLPGRHREGPLPASRYDGDGPGERRLDSGCYSSREWTQVSVSEGDAVIFHGMVPHFSGRNPSERFRRALNISCWSARLRHTGFQPEIHGHADPDRPIDALRQLCGSSFSGHV